MLYFTKKYVIINMLIIKNLMKPLTKKTFITKYLSKHLFCVIVVLID